MSRFNRDVFIAIVLLLLCGAFLTASFYVREVDYGILTPAAWPQIILVALTILSMIYLVQSLRQGAPPGGATPVSIKGVLEKYRNPLWCYALFLLFLLTLDYLGMLIGGVLFVFCLLTAIGGASKRNLITHALIAVIMIGAMWALFTYALGVIFPQGEIFTTL
ncbi:MAG: tripartite tricarboxylate transporter TctB family protein [Gammaproteobacteria bacterium]|nr:tripartite tricarboxylate transporter TctB family protein [Gammaproteobacteria bacterium]MDX2462862.1 tripartite tricarboxylate transporter TctB family protein [Gammaproteobacteria bacterium]